MKVDRHFQPQADVGKNISGWFRYKSHWPVLCEISRMRPPKFIAAADRKFPLRRSRCWRCRPDIYVCHGGVVGSRVLLRSGSLPEIRLSTCAPQRSPQTHLPAESARKISSAFFSWPSRQ